jgi:hypothetical protein
MAQKPNPPDNDETDLRARLAAIGINIDDYPPLLRRSDICNDPKKGVRGIVPLGTKGWDRAVAQRVAPQPIKLMGRSVAWRRADVLRILVDGMKPLPKAKITLRRRVEETASPTA